MQAMDAMFISRRREAYAYLLAALRASHLRANAHLRARSVGQHPVGEPVVINRAYSWRRGKSLAGRGGKYFIRNVSGGQSRAGLTKTSYAT